MVARRVVNARGAALVALALTSFARVAHASPPDLFGYGARHVAMGATGAAYSDDFAAVYANPAGLSRAPRRAVTLGFAGTGFGLRLDGRDFPAERGSATVIGVALPLPFGGVLRDRVALGVGFFTPTDVVLRGRILRPDTSQFPLVPDRVQTVAVMAAAGVRLGWGLRIGGGVAAMAALTGSVIVAADATGRASSRINDQVVATFAPVVGVAWERGPWRAGVTFRGELAARFLVRIIAMDLGLPIPELNISGVAQYDPLQLQLDGAWQHRGWTIALGLTGKRWSDWPGPAEATTPTSPSPPPPDFSDTLVPRAGVEHRWEFDDSMRVAVRGGYFFEPSPAPTATPDRRYLDNDRHAVSAGLSLSAEAARTRVTVDLFGQVHVLAARTSAVGTHGGTLFHAGITASATF